MEKSKTTIKISGGVCLWVFLALLMLKAAGMITCSWWIIFIPLMIVPVAILFWVFVVFLWAFMITIIDIICKVR